MIDPVSVAVRDVDASRAAYAAVRAFHDAGPHAWRAKRGQAGSAPGRKDDRNQIEVATFPRQH